MTSVDQGFSEFDPRSYLDDYYCTVDRENAHLLYFFAELAVQLPTEDALLLDFGCGPSVYSLLSVCKCCSQIHVADYLDANLAEISAWIGDEETAFDWSAFVRHALNVEAALGRCSSKVENVLARTELVRSKISRLLRADGKAGCPLGDLLERHYDIMTSAFCIEHIAHDPEEFSSVLRNISTLLRPGGLLVLVTLENATGITVGDYQYPAMSIERKGLEEILCSCGYRPERIEHVAAMERRRDQYEGFLMAVCTLGP